MATSTDSDRLGDYRRKRDFTRTAEPAGGSSSGSGRTFTVQRHRARRRHYDLRLEHDGVLLSWAVPKGPTLDPNVRRLAVRTEDHPLDYATFEGTIPAGEYGGGDVIVWDRGTWTPGEADDVESQLESGSLHFDIDAERLRGRFVLVQRGRQGAKEQWLLIKKDDDHAVEDWDPEDHPTSVLSGRTNDEVAADPERTWHSDSSPAGNSPSTPRPDFFAASEDEREALAALDGDGVVEIDSRRIAVSNLDKELFPGRHGQPPITKRELIDYHARIGPWILPYLAGRAVNFHRYPDGAGTSGFWQKSVPDGAPDWLDSWRNPDADPGETQRYTLVDSTPALVWAANLAAFEIHPWTSPVTAPHTPSWALVDVDPGPETSHAELLLLVRLHRTALEHLGVEARPKTSGKRGFQIWIPVAPRYTFAETRDWVERLSRAVGASVPELVSWKWRKDERRGLARLDYTQNAINKTLVAPFSVRPAEGAPVSVPLEWDELEDDTLTSDRWTVRDVLDRLHELGDPLAPLIGVEQRLPEL